MNQFQKGLAEAMVGALAGFILVVFIDSLAKDGSLPRYFVLMFGLVNAVASLVTVDSFRSVGLLYAIGWLVGAWLMRSIMGPFDIAVNIGGPILVLALRGWFWIKSIQRGD